MNHRPSSTGTSAFRLLDRTLPTTRTRPDRATSHGTYGSLGRTRGRTRNGTTVQETRRGLYEICMTAGLDLHAFGS